MHLRAIKLRGFKSFPDPVEVRLEPGVAVVVGPNGSGKSNVSDAIVWAAGSLAPSELRAEKPDDVLFAGSSTRGAADHCEVELLFDNEAGDGPVPVPFSEISIKRRLHRGGEGQYLLNGTAVRRIDLVELLSDLGLGGGMHSIIGQGRVEEVLGASAARRRELIEEAAGLGRFKRRKHRAELKLARVAIQVERARDVEEEVRKRLRPLALQATAAERAERLAVEVARLRARIAELDLAAAEERLEETAGRRTAAVLARRHAEKGLEELLAERSRAEDELADAAGKREGATAALYRLRSGAERLELRAEAAVGLSAALQAALDDASLLDDGTSAAARGAAAAHAADAARDRDETAAAARGAYVRLAALRRDDHERAVAALAGADGERARLDGERQRAATLRDRLAGRSRELAAACDRLAVRRESARALAEALGGAVEEARAQAIAGPSPQELKQAADQASAAARTAARERDELAERALLARERLAAVEAALAEREGMPPAARVLAEAGERLALAQLRVSSGAERAVAAALASRAAAVVSADARSALALAERARAEGLGSLTVLTPGSRHPTTEPPVSGARPLSTVAPGADELLPDVWLVEGDQLLDAGHGVVVTADGLGYDPERGEVWFAGDTPESALLELQTRAEALSAEAQALEGELAGSTRHAERLAEAAAAAEAAFTPVAPLLSGRRADPALLARLAAAAGRLDTALAAGAHAAGLLEPALAHGLAEAARDATTLEQALRDRVSEEGRLRSRADAAAAAVAAANLALARLGEGPSAPDPGTDDEITLAARAEQLTAEVAAAAEAAAGAERALAEAERQAGGAGRFDHPALGRVHDACARLCSVLEGAAAPVRALEAPLRARVDVGAQRVSEVGGDLRRLGAAEVELRRASGEAGERLSAIDVEVARIEAERDEARRRLEETGAETAAGGDDREELAVRVERLERRRETLGRVNPLAKEEYEAEKERLEELSVQREDLERSLNELARLRAELAETVETRFAETFAAVETRFTEVARTLFPGGEGRLRLTLPEEPDGEGGPAPPGVEVELRPAGKKITRLSLLSGGEKALGAISFLFALFLARPCPFYLLDEVEAALDDTNIGRFVELLRRHADEAQFVVITHQKRTMEAADVLYGVTMGGDGISQIVSRRLPADDREALSAA